MIKITKDINFELDEYLEKRKKENPNYEKKIIKKDKKNIEDIKKDINDEKEIKTKKPKKGIIKRFLDFISGDEDNMEEETLDENIKSKKDENSLETKREENNEINYNDDLKSEKKAKKSKGFFAKIRSWFSEEAEFDEEEEETIEEKKEILPDDIKEVLKIQNKWLSKLPKEVLHEFKNTEDYQKYKETLKKYNLIK
ncbi:MAG: hypothetical protein QXE31_01460 [Candidatus Woesearchaeota archaeon]